MQSKRLQLSIPSHLLLQHSGFLRGEASRVLRRRRHGERQTMRVVDKPFGDKLLKEFWVFGSHGFEFGDFFVESKGGHRIAVVITGSDQTENQAKSEVGRLVFQLREGKEG